MFNWFKILWNLSDDKLVEINGLDYTLYLVFLRYSALFFACLTIYNLIFMIPVYVTGSPDPDAPSSSNTTMNQITILNVTKNNGKMAFTYFSSLFILAAGLLLTM